MKKTYVMMAEIEIEDGGHSSEEAKEALAKGKLENLRFATTKDLVEDGWDEYLVPRMTGYKKDKDKIKDYPDYSNPFLFYLSKDTEE